MHHRVACQIARTHMRLCPQNKLRRKCPQNKLRPFYATRQPGAVRVEGRRVDVLANQRAGLSLRLN